MKTHQTITCLLSAALMIFSPVTLHADMVDTPTMLALDADYVQAERIRQEAHLESFLARDEVRTQLESLGVSSELAVERVQAMTDSQLQQLALRLDEMPAGGGALGIVATVLLIVLLLEILGVTNIFHKV